MGELGFVTILYKVVFACFIYSKSFYAAKSIAYSAKGI